VWGWRGVWEAKGMHPSAVGRAVMHNDIGPAILASIPFDLEIIRT